MRRPYRVGEIVLMDYQGWLKAFRVVKVQRDEGERAVEYTLAMVEMENQPGWTKPTRVSDPRDWTVFDPKVRLEEHSHETAHIVVATYLPTGEQVSCGDFPHMIQNRIAALERLKLQVAGQ